MSDSRQRQRLLDRLCIVAGVAGAAIGTYASQHATVLTLAIAVVVCWVMMFLSDPVSWFGLDALDDALKVATASFFCATATAVIAAIGTWACPRLFELFSRLRLDMFWR